LALVGELGSGKTTFVQGVASAFGIKGYLVSPTFILIRKYKIGIIPENKFLRDFYHIDLYRINGKNIKDEIENLGLKEIISGSGNVVLIEWAEKIKKFLPENTYWVNFSYLGKNLRLISFSGKF